MDNKIASESRKKEVICNGKQEPSSGPGPFIRLRYERNEKNGSNQLVGVELSDGTKIESKEAIEKYKAALKKATGTDDTDLGERIYRHLAVGLAVYPECTGLERLLTLLPGLGPQNENEAMLLGQFVALQESGFRCLQYAINAENFQNTDRMYSLSTKLFRTANETMQTLLKFRTGGRQEIQIVHIQNDGQAIITQNLSNKGGGAEKSED